MDTKGAAYQPKYWSKQLPAERAGRSWDYIVIGSGMGGMTTAAILAKQGKKVLVLEQHYTPGGFTHMFRRPGYNWDVGVHIIGNVTHHSSSGRLLASLTDGDLHWQSVGTTYDHFTYPDNFEISFADTPAQFMAALIAAFPAEEDAIRSYFKLIKQGRNVMQRHFLRRLLPRTAADWLDRWGQKRQAPFVDRSTKEAMAALTSDPRLQTVLLAQWGYYGSIPSQSSFAIQALVACHFLHGGYYPVGGSREIARYLLRSVAAAGGWCRVRADVDEILIENGRATGVRLVDGETIRAPRIISAAGVPATIRRLLPAHYQQTAWAQEILQLPSGPAHVCLYIGFKGDIAQAGATAANQWFYETWDSEDGAWDISKGEDLPDAPILYCSFPSLKDPDHDPGIEQRHTGEIVTFVPWEAFVQWREQPWRKRGNTYDGLKEEMQGALLEQFLRHRPALRPLIDYVELSTPLSTDHFVRPSAGSIYGLASGPARFQCAELRPKSRIPGLYFSGCDVAATGVMGAMMGGVMAAAAAEPFGTANYLRRATKK